MVSPEGLCAWGEVLCSCCLEILDDFTFEFLVFVSEVWWDTWAWPRAWSPASLGQVLGCLLLHLLAPWSRPAPVLTGWESRCRDSQGPTIHTPRCLGIKHGGGHSHPTLAEPWWLSGVLKSVQLLSPVRLLGTHGVQHARFPCPSPTLKARSNSCPLSQWCHPASSSSVVPFASCLQSFLASGSFPVS